MSWAWFRNASNIPPFCCPWLTTTTLWLTHMHDSFNNFSRKQRREKNLENTYCFFKRTLENTHYFFVFSYFLFYSILLYFVYLFLPIAAVVVVLMLYIYWFYFFFLNNTNICCLFVVVNYQHCCTSNDVIDNNSYQFSYSFIITNLN